MDFLVDAQLPGRLSVWLIENGHDCLHTLDLPGKNRTPDTEIADLSDTTGRILISKDRDFLNLKIIEGRPNQILLVTTGNIDNASLLSIFGANIDSILKVFQTFEIVELGNDFVIGKNLE